MEQVAVSGLLTPNDAAAVVGVSRQAVMKRRWDLTRAGQALESGGRWWVKCEGLAAWWIQHTRHGDALARLVAMRRLLGEGMEERLHRAGGLEAVEKAVQLLASLAPGWCLEVDTLEAVATDGSRAPLAELWACWSEVLLALQERYGPGITADDEGVLHTAAGAELGLIWEWRLQAEVEE